MKLFIILCILGYLISRWRGFHSPVSSIVNDGTRKRMNKRTKYSFVILICIVLLLSLGLFISNDPKLIASRLYKNEQFLENSCQLYLWMSSKGEDSILVENGQVYYSENGKARLSAPWSNYAEYLIQNKVTTISYCDRFMDLQLGETLSGRVFCIRLSDESEPPRDNHSYHLLGQYAINDIIINIYYYEGYNDFGDTLIRKPWFGDNM